MHAESGNHLYSINILTEESNANQKRKRKKRIFSAVECEVSTNPIESRNPRNGWKISADLYLQRFFPAKKICKWISRRWGFYSVLESWKRVKGCIVRVLCQRNKEAPRNTLRDHARVCTLYTHKGVWSAACLLFVVWLCVCRSDRSVRDRFEASRKRGGVSCV
jgi:hypothetical protein